MKEIGDNLAWVIMVLMIGSCTIAQKHYNTQKELAVLQCEQMKDEEKIRNR